MGAAASLRRAALAGCNVKSNKFRPFSQGEAQRACGKREGREGQIQTDGEETFLCRRVRWRASRVYARLQNMCSTDRQEALLAPREKPASTHTCCGTCQKLNRNVRLVLVYAITLSVISSLISQTPLAAYILLVRQESGVSHDYGAVGVATGLQGVVSVLVALPAGIIADRMRRQMLLRIASILGVITAGYTAWCVVYVAGDSHDFSRDDLFYALCGSSALWGLFMGLHSAPLEALFGDSIVSGQRSKLYVWRSSLRTLGNVVGPLISIFVFLHGACTATNSTLAPSTA